MRKDYAAPPIFFFLSLSPCVRDILQRLLLTLAHTRSPNRSCPASITTMQKKGIRMQFFFLFSVVCSMTGQAISINFDFFYVLLFSPHTTFVSSVSVRETITCIQTRMHTCTAKSVRMCQCVCFSHLIQKGIGVTKEKQAHITYTRSCSFAVLILVCACVCVCVYASRFVRFVHHLHIKFCFHFSVDI